MWNQSTFALVLLMIVTENVTYLDKFPNCLSLQGLGQQLFWIDVSYTIFLSARSPVVY